VGASGRDRSTLLDIVGGLDTATADTVRDVVVVFRSDQLADGDRVRVNR
jgi:hypothetical protein